MKRLIPILASAASMAIPVAAMADNIVCHGGWALSDTLPVVPVVDS